MGKVIVICDRCKQSIAGLRLPSGTSGFYEGSWWKKYMAKHENILCDECMRQTDGYKRDYPGWDSAKDNSVSRV